MVDLPPTRTLPWTSWWRRAGITVLPAIQRWCTTPAVIPSETLVSQLVHFAPRRAGGRDLLTVALLLDGDRAGPNSGSASRRRFDNRHLLNVDLLPPPDFLMQQGLARAQFVVTEEVASDLRPYAERLRSGGLEVATPDLTQRARTPH